MAKQNRFSKIDKILPINVTGKGSDAKRRTTANTKKDEISKQLAGCQRPSDVAVLAAKFGLTDEDITARAKAAPNFGMFRMIIGNLIRGICSRIAAAKKEGVKLSVQNAAYPKKAEKVKKAKKTNKAKKATKKAKKKRKRTTNV